MLNFNKVNETKWRVHSSSIRRGGGGGVSVRKRKTDDIHSVMIHKNTEDRE